MRTVSCQSERLRIEVLPELGAKVTSLLDRVSGREWLTAPTRPYRPARLDDDFGNYDRSGWDECFPSILPGFHPTPPWRGVPLAPHGELWSRPWSCEASGDGIAAIINGVRFPYRFARRLALAGAEVRADYRVSNPTEFPFPCLWAMHPLLVAAPGMRVVLASETAVVCDHSTEGVGYLERRAWPREHTLDEARRAEKLFTERGRVDRAALVHPGGAWLGFAFDAPYLGLWLNEGGWPEEGEPLYHVGLEPTTGQSDDLEVAMRLGEVTVVPPLGSVAWSVTLTVGDGADALDAYLRAADAVAAAR